MTSATLLSPRFQFNPDRPFKPSVSSVQRDLIDDVAEKLSSNRYTLHPTDCPCGAAKDTDVVLSEIDRYGFNLQSVLCMNCGTVRFDPYLDADSLNDFYSHTYRKMYGLDIQDKGYDDYFAGQSSYARKILSVTQSSLQPNSWICEVGCGGGGALKYLQDQGFNVAGCDYDIAALEFAKQQGVQNTCYGGLEAIASQYADIKFDLIYLHHVFEHLSDPIAFLKDCKQYLTPQGKVVVIVPDVHQIDRIGTQPAMGNLLMYLHIAHKYNFSLEGIQQLCVHAGYRATQLKPDPKMLTRGSSSPELWVEMQNTEVQSSDRPEARTSLSSTPVGTKTLRYFQNTEKLYALGLCIGQIKYKMELLKSPEKLIERLQQKTKRKKPVASR
jgi:2-polyprenyl-3-methyl-5-hydroxy-6-metoxy-1,4-benzoquinol methylase